MSISCPTLINSLGLLLDIVGVIILWKYGLPESLSREGHISIVTEQIDETEKAKAALYDRWSKFGLFFLITGFVFQLISNFL